MAKRGKEQKRYSAELKISAILDMREHNLGYNETVRKYKIGGSSMGGARDVLKTWERIYLEEGAEGLMKERRGRSSKGRPPKNRRILFLRFSGFQYMYIYFEKSDEKI